MEGRALRFFASLRMTRSGLRAMTCPKTVTLSEAKGLFHQ